MKQARDTDHPAERRVKSEGDHWTPAMVAELLDERAPSGFEQWTNVPLGRREASGFEQWQRPPRFELSYYKPTPRAAVLIATKDGEATIAQTIRAAGDPLVEVFVVSDGSTDNTVAVARAAGANVLALAENVGKPAALYQALHRWRMFSRFEYVAILDDDTTVEEGFVRKCLEVCEREPEAVVVVARTLSDWPHEHRWNAWVGSRMFAYWKYQATIKRGQSALNAVNCVAGSNSLYRTDTLKQVIREDTPYVVDDCYWTHEIQREKLGRIHYEPTITAYVQDPTNLREWWKQNLRWLWGTLQAIWGHKVARRASWFDFWYAMQLFDWAWYLTGPAVILVLALVLGWTFDFNPLLFLAFYSLPFVAWTTAAAIAVRKPRMVAMMPAFMVIDLLYRLLFWRAIVKTIRQPTVESCRWESPARYEQREEVSA